MFVGYINYKEGSVNMVGVKNIKESAKIELEPETKELEPMQTMCSVEEFVRSNLAKRSYPVESLNSFMFWMKRNGCPKRWPPTMWQAKFEEFLNRKV